MMDMMKLTFVNVGYGEAMIVECPDPACAEGTFVMVIDGGSDESSEFEDRSSGRLRLVEYLHQRKLRHIDVMVSTHLHEDHLCGLVPAAKLLPPKRLWQTLPPGFYREMKTIDPALARTQSMRLFFQTITQYQTLCHMVETNGGTIEIGRAHV